MSDPLAALAAAVPEEVYEVAARARRLAMYGHCADGLQPAPGDHASVDAVWPVAFAAGRASIHAEWAQSLAEDGPDETGDIRMRADALARRRVETTVRAEVAAEIRHLLFFAVRAPVDGFTAEGRCSVDEWYPADVIDAIVARIAEGKTDTKEETHGRPAGE